MIKQPLLSIVVTSYTMERLKDIYELLDTVKAQTYPYIEIIFVAECSRELYEKMKAYAEQNSLQTQPSKLTRPSQLSQPTKPIHMKVLFNDGEPGASAARNLGSKAAEGEIITFVDDDVVLFADWAEEMVKTYRDNSIIGVTGPALPLWEDEPIPWFPEEFYWIISCTSWFNCNKIREVRNVWLENASFRKDAFDKAGLLDVRLGPQDSIKGFKGREFKERIISEEVELSLRIRERTGKRIVYNPNVKVKHRIYKQRLKLSYIIPWAYWMGSSKCKIRKLYPQANREDPLISQERELLERIFRKLFPSILKSFFGNPLVAGRKFSITVTVLFFVTLGYYSHLPLRPFKR